MLQTKAVLIACLISQSFIGLLSENKVSEQISTAACCKSNPVQNSRSRSPSAGCLLRFQQSGE